MRIAHISDLHFGKHHTLLTNNLKDRISALKCDLVICSGDVADDTSDDLTEDARLFLDELASRCAETTNGPRLIVVPGNHDTRKNGWLYGSREKPSRFPRLVRHATRSSRRPVTSALQASGRASPA